MAELPSNEFVELRDGAYYVPGKRIGLDVLYYAYRRGETAEELFEAFPGIGSLDKVRGILQFIDDYPEAVQTYLASQEALWDKLRREHPIPPDDLARYQRALEELEREDL